uniref:hypothetical protein Ycf1 n=1 Tax=Platymiscium pubescens TaxID=557744 RepID=UPI00220FDE4D|nr:hypothetical protein Ycf1 [Platymiscium pubescens]UXL84431.1 hypothetical protein Ycf1 [Platymiscium pubescens]
MIFQSFILDNLVSLCMKIMNSVVVVGLYYGFLSTFSIGPSYLFLLRARVMQEGTEKKLSATAGFITGQLIMFISIYYAPLHLALGRPHIITVIALPYLLFHLFGNNNKDFLNYGYKNPNSIRNLSIQKIFFNNLIFQLFNPLVLPSSILVRLVNLYMFRCNIKILFLTSAFFGWITGQLFLMKWVGLIFIWIQQKNFIEYNVPIRSNKSIISEFRSSMSQIFIFFFFITFLYYLGKTPLPFFYKTRTKQEKNISTEEDTSSYLSLEKSQNSYKINESEDKKISVFKKSLVTIFFDFKRWKRPLRYIKNARFENFVRYDMSQFFFDTCKSDGKDRICFTYPPDLSTFLKIMETKTDLLTTEKIFYDELHNEFYNYWNFRNEEKRKKLSNEFLNRAKVMDKEFLPLDIFEKRIRLCNEETQTKNLPKIYDPFLNGPCRGRIKNFFVSSIKIQKKTSKKNEIWINKIHGLLLYINSIQNHPEFEQKIDILDRKSFLTEIRFFFYLIRKFSDKSVSSLNFEGLVFFPEHELITSEKKKIKFLFDTIRTDLNEKKKKSIGMKEMRKQVPRWSYKLIDELQELEGKSEREKHGIRSRKAKRVVIFTFPNKSQNETTSRYARNTKNTDKKRELALIRYAQQPDFRRDIIKGSIRAQRRKTVTWKFFQTSLHSPLFLEKIEKTSLFSFLKNYEPMRKMLFLFQNKMRTKAELQNSDYTEEKTKESKEEGERKKKEKEEKRRIEIAEAWDSIIVAQVIRGSLLIAQSILRKYILLPSLIITKNIFRMLLFQFPEWSEDYRDWKREIYIKCTYNGVQLSETEFPKNWLIDGIQIKIIYPFRLKPWHRSKLRSTEKDPIKQKAKKKKDFCFLTILGMEVELPFSSYPRNRFSFFHPIFKELKKKMKKWKNTFFLVLKILNERTNLFINFSKERAKWIIKKILLLNEKIKQLPTLFILRFKKICGLSESQKDSTMSKKNPMIYESTIRIQSINWTNCLLKKKKIKDLNAKRKIIIKKIKKMTKEKKKGVLTSEINISSNKASYYAKRLELKKNIWQILQKRNPLLDYKSEHSFLKSLMKKVYLDILLCIINIPRGDVRLFLESRNIIKKKSIYSNETNVERTDKTNQSRIHFISLLKKPYNIRNTNSQNSCDVSSLSQAYVFFKLSETQVINIYKLRSVFEYNGKSFFLKNEIKDFFFGIQRIFYSKLKQKNPPNSLMNQWKNWLLKGHYQYDLSQRRWARLVPQKWKNRIYERHASQNKDFKKCNSYEEKTRLILYKNQQLDLLKNKKKYEYDLFSYKSINYANKKDSDIYGYESSFQANNKTAISYNYNTRKKYRFDLTSDISIKKYIAEDAILDMEKNLDRKYFDWMGINGEIFNRCRSNREFLFFSKFWIFYNAYTSNLWIIPIQLLFFNFNINQNGSENQNITRNQKIIDIFRSSKKKKDFELETRNQAKAEYTDQVDLESSLSTYEKDIEEDYTGLDRKKDINKKQYKTKIEAELFLLLKKFLVFQLNWRGSLNQRVMNNIKIYCLLIRLKNLKEIAITSVQRGELSLDIMLIHNKKDLTLTELTKKNKLIQKGILIIEPVRLSRKNDEQFFFYQTISLSLIHKSKRQFNQRYPEKSHVDKKNFEKSISKTRDKKITENKEKNHYDLLVPEFFFSARRRREFRILICFNSKNRNSIHGKARFYKKNNNCCNVLAKNKDEDLDRGKKKLMNFHYFLWPKFRLEDLACMNRYWFDTYNGSRFSIVRIHMYPRLRIR